MKLQILFVFLCLFGGGSAFFWDAIVNLFRAPEWNSLKVRWGLNPITNFNSMPRTASHAISHGWVKVSDCDASPDAKHRGSRYVKDGDEALVLLYDKNGYIAGIQTVIPDGLANDYPERALTPPFVQIGSSFYLTAYFVQPDTICSTGRTQDEFEEHGTGTMLLIQNGSSPDSQYVTIPKEESGLAGTKWTKGKCFISMGHHYWYDVRTDTDCDTLFPVFLLYNSNKLNGFGWAMVADLSSPRYEHPPKDIYSKFISDVPTCLYERGRLSTMHIFLDNTPLFNFC